MDGPDDVDDALLTIGEVARRAGVPTSTVRFYERRGLLDADARRSAQRRYRVDVDWAGGHLALRVAPRFVDPADAVATGSLLAPMPGTVVSVAVEAGQHVEAGQSVLVLEAMKMQHRVSAPYAGTVTEIDVKPGQQVAAGEVLAVVEEVAPRPTRDPAGEEGN